MLTSQRSLSRVALRPVSGARATLGAAARRRAWQGHGPAPRPPPSHLRDRIDAPSPLLSLRHRGSPLVLLPLTALPSCRSLPPPLYPAPATLLHAVNSESKLNVTVLEAVSIEDLDPEAVQTGLAQYTAYANAEP